VHLDLCYFSNCTTHFKFVLPQKMMMVAGRWCGRFNSASGGEAVVDASGCQKSLRSAPERNGCNGREPYCMRFAVEKAWANMLRLKCREGYKKMTPATELLKT